jgi:hypothetical protein
MPPAKKKVKKPAQAVVNVDIVPKKRKKPAPRSAFKPGNPHAFKPGESGNPGGKPRLVDHLLSKTLRVALCDRAPDELAKSFALPSGSSWAQCIARKLIYMAVRGDLQAMREIREATEGTRVHASIDFPDPADVPPVILVEFVSSDGNGKPAPGITIEANSTPQPPALPCGTD